ncbi:Uncharacterised protein [Chromobacterium violaceum]|uniref:Uncharacterized protein n=1 Tax=Chromobacterium violaceum TaxID=536 RepID=A0A3S4LEK0_CHRVL|nr:Uncharacterised protein [Chromobacterium violaceum]
MSLSVLILIVGFSIKAKAWRLGKELLTAPFHSSNPVGAIILAR